MNKILIEWAQSLLEAIIIVLLLFIFFWPLKIDGRSMEATFFSDDRVIISRALVFFTNIKHSDILVCKIADDEDKEVTILKRAIALPGDKIKIDDGKVYVNNRLLLEDYVLSNVGFNLNEVTLDENQYFVMGDNRELSLDSRHIGPVSKDKIIGKVLLRWFPFNEIKIF